MTIAVMQPYIFPYIGYYQLVNAVDTFVFFDDVNFIMKGWINRNRIIQQNEPLKFVVPLKKASQNRLINEIEIADFDKWRKDFLKLIEFNYKKAPFYSFFYEWLRDFLYSNNYNLISQMASDSVIKLATLLGLPTQFMYSSSLNYSTEEPQGGQDKILKICSILQADRYINPKNGMDMYEEASFSLKGITLNFIQMDDIVYKQFETDKFVSSLSIIDVLMFNDVERAREMLSMYMLKNKNEYDEAE